MYHTQDEAICPNSLKSPNTKKVEKVTPAGLALDIYKLGYDKATWRQFLVGCRREDSSEDKIKSSTPYGKAQIKGFRVARGWRKIIYEGFGNHSLPVYWRITGIKLPVAGPWGVFWRPSPGFADRQLELISMSVTAVIETIWFLLPEGR